MKRSDAMLCVRASERIRLLIGYARYFVLDVLVLVLVALNEVVAPRPAERIRPAPSVRTNHLHKKPL